MYSIDVVNLYTLALPFEDMSECTVHFVCRNAPGLECKGVAVEKQPNNYSNILVVDIH